MPITIPDNVTVEINQNQLTVSGPKGKVSQQISPLMTINREENQILLKTKGKTLITKSLHGLSRSLIANMVKGVVDGFVKTLELQGVGYRAAKEGQNLKLLVGFSHPVVVEPPQGIEYQVEGTNLIKISGPDRQLVGQTAAKIRNIRPPEVYKGKGIRYKGEVIKLKPGKSAKAGMGATGAA